VLLFALRIKAELSQASMTGACAVLTVTNIRSTWSRTRRTEFAWTRVRPNDMVAPYVGATALGQSPGRANGCVSWCPKANGGHASSAEPSAMPLIGYSTHRQKMKPNRCRMPRIERVILKLFGQSYSSSVVQKVGRPPSRYRLSQ